jgi:hypothetical protein
LNTFLTPEAYHSINDWMTYRRECGELINEDSWVMRNLWNSTTPKGKGTINNPRNLKSTGVKQLMQPQIEARKREKAARISSKSCIHKVVHNALRNGRDETY